MKGKDTLEIGEQRDLSRENFLESGLLEGKKKGRKSVRKRIVSNAGLGFPSQIINMKEHKGR